MEALKSTKAQLFSMDVIIAVTLSMLALSIVAMYWNTSAKEINEQQSRKELERAAFDASAYLLNVMLVNELNIFDPSKLLSIVLCNYNQTKETIGLSGFEFYINLTYTNYTTVTINGNPVACGSQYESAETLVVVKRSGIFNNEKVVLSLYVWK